MQILEGKKCNDNKNKSIMNATPLFPYGSQIFYRCKSEKIYPPKSLTLTVDILTQQNTILLAKFRICYPNGEIPVQEIWEEWSCPSLPLLLGPLRPGVVVPVRVPSMDQIDLFKNYSYSIGPCVDKSLLRNNSTKNVNMNV